MARESLIGWLANGDFASLESRLNDVQRGFVEGRFPEDTVIATYDGFARSDPAMADQLAAWLAADPQSPAATLAAGIYYWHLARITQGDRFAGPLAGDAYLQLDDLKGQAIGFLERALSLDEALVPAYVALFGAFSHNFNHRAITDLFLAGMEAVPGSPAIIRAHAETLVPHFGVPLNKLEEFLALSRRQVGDDPRFQWIDGFFEYAGAMQLWLFETPEDAIGSFDRAVGQTDDAMIRATRGEYLFEQGRFADALADMRAAMEAMPRDPRYRAFAGAALAELGRVEEALAELDPVVDQDPYNPMFRRMRGRALALAGEPALAEADLDAALVYGRHQHYLHAARASLYAGSMGRFDLAQEAWSQAKQLSPGTNRYWLELADAQFRVGNCDVYTTYQSYRARCYSRGPCEHEQFSFPEQLVHMVCPMPWTVEEQGEELPQ